MNKHLYALGIGIMIASACISQTSKKDTTCIPNDKLREAIAKIEEGKVAKQEILILKEQIQIQEKRIIGKDSSIQVLVEKNKTQEQIAKNFDLFVANLNKQIEINKLQNEVLEKQLKKEKGKKWMFTISAAIITFLSTALYYGK
jgi:hypothetical protein